jgi:hypothetical protein
MQPAHLVCSARCSSLIALSLHGLCGESWMRDYNRGIQVDALALCHIFFNHPLLFNFAAGGNALMVCKPPHNKKYAKHQS